MRYWRPPAPAKAELDDLQPLTLEQASIAVANAAVAEDIASRALRYALAAAISSSKHVIDCLKSFLVINAWFSGRLTFEPVVVVENEGEGALAPQTEWSMVDELLRESMRGLEVDIDRLILLGRKM